MSKILLVQSRTDPMRIERERNNFAKAVGGVADLDFLSSLDLQFAWAAPEEFLAGYDGVMFGGSSDFDFHGGRVEGDSARITSMEILARTRPLVAHAFERHIPILGVCFGHQLIAQMHGGKVNNDKAQHKFGGHEVHLTPDGAHDPLFKNLPQSFMAQYAHKDSVTNLPSGATLLATGTSCRFSALRYGSKAYTVQFHPEIKRMTGATKASPQANEIVRLWIEKIVVHAGEISNANSSKKMSSLIA
jgi:GMP synthase-like glutamine amidotransferase